MVKFIDLREKQYKIMVYVPLTIISILISQIINKADNHGSNIFSYSNN